MVEIISISQDWQEIYKDFIPSDPSAVRLHHHGFRLRTAKQWEQVVERVERSGFATLMKESVLDG